MAITLTAPLLRQIRTADSVVFRHKFHRDTIELTHKLRPSDDKSLTILEAGIIETYSIPFDSAFSMIGSAQFSESWRTIATMLRAGDEIRLEWLPDYHSNDYARMVGLHVDVVRLDVRRKDNRLTFDLNQSVCPDNSARMMQGVRPRDSYGASCLMAESWDSLTLRAERLERERVTS